MKEKGTTNISNNHRSKLNTTMLIMQCIGIFSVVLGHAEIGGSPIPNVINLAFPYYSWHMPFFIFISGYFFNRSLPIGKYVSKKFLTHLVPALIVNFIYGIFSFCIKEFGLAVYGRSITFKSLFITPFTNGYQFCINVSLWFILALFVIECISCIMDRISKGKADFTFLLITFFVSIYCCFLTFYFREETKEEFLNAGLRLGFLMFFFWLGACYRKYFEKKMKKLINIKLSLVVFFIQATYLGITGYNITINTREMLLDSITVPDGFWVAILSPITAIVFFLGIAYSLTPYLENNKILALIGTNCKYVVYHHQFLFLLYSFGIGSLIEKNIIKAIPGFDFGQLQLNKYYSGGNIWLSTCLVFACVFIPIIVCKWISNKKWYISVLVYLILILLIIEYLHLASRAIY